LQTLLGWQEGGVILILGGILELKYVWGLGTSKNNQDEAYALLEGLKIAKGIDVQKLCVIGDPKNVSMHLVLYTNPCYICLASLLEWINQEVKNLLEVKYFHVLQENNALTNNCANQGTLLKMVEIMVNGKFSNQPSHS
jgi:ribonuclease HI